ncbi:MAG: glycosyltransferase family 2 protein [Bacteroidota bacterium]
MASHPKMSIITVVKNDQKGLARTVDSIRAQHYIDYEHLIIDGGSTDGTAEWISQLDPAPDYWVSEPDDGVYHAMNKGLDKVKGTWVYFLNAGDHLSDDFALSKAVGSMKRDYHLMYWDIYRVSEQGEQSIWRQKDLFKFGLFNNVCHQALWYNRSLLHDFRFDTDFKVAADANLLIQLLGNYQPLRYFRLPVPLAVFYDGGISTKGAYNALLEREIAFARWNKPKWIKRLNHLNLIRQQKKLLKRNRSVD